MFGWRWLIHPLRAWTERRCRLSDNRRTLQLAHGELLRFEAAGDAASAKFWEDAIDELRHCR